MELAPYVSYGQGVRKGAPREIGVLLPEDGELDTE